MTASTAPQLRAAAAADRVTRDRLRRLLAYLEAVRASLDRSPRVPGAGGEAAFWAADLAATPGARVGPAPEPPGSAGHSDRHWLVLRRPPAQPAAPDTTAAPSTPAGPDAPDGLAAARRRYRDLWDLALRLGQDQATIELVWGHGILSWPGAAAGRHHPLLVTPVRAEADAERGELRVRPLAPTTLELAFLDGLRLPGAPGLAKLRDRLRDDPVDPWDRDRARAVYTRVADQLGLAWRLLDEGADAPADVQLTISDTAVLYARPRRAAYRRFYQLALDALGDDRSNHPLSSPLADVTAPSATPPRARPAVAARLLLPLPANREQEEIARRLADHRGVTVQGPPGTGKTHTIANLLAHLMAQGKRVLVTSHREQPLEVLRGALPERIRPLCVSLLGAGAGEFTQLDQSVQAILRETTTLDRRRARWVIDQAGGELDRIDAELATLRRDLAACIERERARYEIAGRSRSVAEVGRYLAAADPALDFVPDRLDPDAALPLDTAELAELYRLAALPPAERDAVGLRRPDPATLPRGAGLRALRAQLTAANTELDQLRARHTESRIAPSMSPKGLAAIAARVERVAERHRQVTGAWLTDLSDELRRSAPSRAFWKEFGAFVDTAVAELYELNRTTSPHELTLPTGIANRTLVSHLTAIRDLLAAGRSIRRITSPLGSIGRREQAAVARQCQVDGSPLRTAEDAELLLAAARSASRRGELVVAWNREMAKIGGPQVDPDDAHAERTVEREHAALREALTFETADWPELRERLSWAGVQVSPTPSVEELDQLRQDVDLARVRLGRQADERRALQARSEAQAALDQVRDTLAAGRAGPTASPLWGELAAALAHGDDDAWDAALTECARLDALAPAVARFDTQLARLRDAAPLWAERLIAGRGSPATGDPARAHEAWQLAQARTWLDRLVAAEDPAGIQERLAELQTLRQQRVHDLVSWSTWLAAAERVTDTHRRALNGLVQALRRADTGPDTARYHAIAWQALDGCRDAVGAWIMPAYRVVETFTPRDQDAAGEPPFDVLIVDEASQCDLRAVGLLGLARQVVIVGDDRQISPSLGADRDEVRALIAKHIPDLPNAELLDATASLYDVAKWTYPGVVMLREHFRCLPAIIGFSNELAYDGEILPLREAPTDPAWQPVRAVRVPEGACAGGRNDAEARALVDAVAACCAEPAYDGLTMGVISLLGEAQARHVQHLLLERLGERELASRRLTCGDAYRFQGDERAVVFLSMVTDAGSAEPPMTGVADRQRLNVAASRARDQLWLFHSVDADQLHADDVRGQLLRYCQHPARPRGDGEHVDDGAEPALVAAVRHELHARGYRVRPRVRVGHFGIDLVVEGGTGRRLAVECDGEAGRGFERWEEDERRQLILERLGWRFHRIRGSAFYRDPEAALAPLVRRLDTLGIRPETPGSG